MRAFLCLLFGGHDLLTTFDARRIFLKCSDCGHETPGIEIEGGLTLKEKS